MSRTPPIQQLLTVGQLADLAGTTVRTLHHYDEIGLLSPGERTAAGYRLYTEDDVRRLRHVVVYRRLGFALEDVKLLLDDPRADVAAHLRRQRDAVTTRLDELSALVQAIDRALEAELSGIRLTKDEQRQLFGEGFSEEYAGEAERRWGRTEAWKESQARTSRYSKDDWVEITRELDAVHRAFVEAMDAGPPSSDEAMDAAEQARLHIDRRFYDCSHDVHRTLGDMYVADPRFTKTYEDMAPGLAHYVRDAIHANADRHAFREG
jgi:DNA-binding transcriptional MerR regulator